MVDNLRCVPLYQLAERSNYRQEYDMDFISRTAADMSTNGFDVAHPIETYAEDGHYVIIDGHTRFKSALLGSIYTLHTHQPIMPIWIVVKDKPTDSEFKLKQIAANEQRVDPDDISKAIGYQQALDYGATIEDLIESTRHDRGYVERRLCLLKLTNDIQELVAKKQLPITYAGAITQLDSNRQRMAVQAYNKAKSPNLDEFKAMVSRLYEQQVIETQQGNFFGLFTADEIAAKAESLADEISAPRVNVKQLQAELEAEKIARQRDREYARTKYMQAQREIAELKAQLYQQGEAVA